jgi:hypothetical protein
MALEDNLLPGVYVGLVVDVQDPDELGRIKVMIPGKMGTLYKGWNELNTDIDFFSTTPDVFPEDILIRIRKNIPWARPAMPIWGGGTGSYNFSDGVPYTVPTDSAFSGETIALNGSNGRLNINDPNQLVPLQGFPGEYAHPIVAGKLQELVAAAKRDGINLGITDSYRTFNEQVILKQRKPGLAATPGRSNHGWGLAFDFKGINGTSKQDAYTWLKNNAPKYGWANFVGGYGPDTRGAGGTQLEPWHWQINRSDLGKYANYSVLGGPRLGGSLANVPSNNNPDNRLAVADGVHDSTGTFNQATPIGTGTFSPTCQAVNPSDQYKKILNILKDKETYNKGNPPPDGLRFGVNSGTPESWASFYTNIAGWESGGDPCKPFFDGPDDVGGSGGLYQLGRDQIEIWANKYPNLARQYGLEPGRNYTEQELYNADLNTRGMLFIGDALLRENYVVGRGGLGRTIGNSTTLRKQEIYISGQGDPRYVKGPPWKTGETTPPQLVQRTTNQGINAYGSINVGRSGMPVGMFSPPAFGAKVWVMFEGGSPQRPVYMGQVYDPSNIGAVA